ncbi:MAG: DUF4424 domain-containing protein [Sphingosinicella sp.]|uniref:DUF4424 domain-containing protein n=1 Tax=Sphingosinicella sp. TaxID=1917971 RepID=UPI0040381BC6
MRRLLWAVAGLCALGGIAAHANDSTAENGAGGLVLTKTDAIDMVSEDLYVSPSQIRVRYVFRNRTTAPVRTTVAFPLPDRNLAELSEGDSAWPADFSTRVDGRPIAMQVERRAMLGTTDHSALLRELNVPIAEDNIVVAASEAVARLNPSQQQRLERLGLIEAFGQGSGRYYEPRWTVRETWHWEQAFPPGRDVVVAHEYTPGAGGTVTTGLANREYREGEGGREQIATYCIDDDFLAGVDRLGRQSGQEGALYATIAEQWVSYILTTGANWRSPIGEFRLVVDKERPENLVSFCGEGVRRISPTQFEMRRRNWRPTQDLRVLVLRPYRYDE